MPCENKMNAEMLCLYLITMTPDNDTFVGFVKTDKEHHRQNITERSGSAGSSKDYEFNSNRM